MSRIQLTAMVLALLIPLTVHADADKDLRKAAKKGDVEKMQKALTKGANVNAKDKKDNSPLSEAIQKRKDEAVELLLDVDADPNTIFSAKKWKGDRKKSKLPLLQWVIVWNYNKDSSKRENAAALNIMKHLLKAGAKPTDEILQYAIENKARPAVKLLLESGADANAVMFTAYMSAGIVSALTMAAMGGDTEIVQSLLEAGANVHARPPGQKRTALEAAEKFNHDDVAKLLRGAMVGK